MDRISSSRDGIASWLALTLVPGVPPTALRALLAAFGAPHAVLSAAPGEIAAIAGSAVATALARRDNEPLVDSALRWLEHPGHHLVAFGDADYPSHLLEVEHPPPVLYVAGRRELLDAPAFAIVGSRNATMQGARDAEAFAQALSADGLAIVSGLALGIDAAAHRGGLRERGSSIAVMGTGADIHYPAGNRELAARLAAEGALISEFPLGTPAREGNFPRRNRLISGLSRGVLVVEAAMRSGSLITARLALDQGRDVFAIPGSIHSPLSKGCHWLIKQGAKLVESADDIACEIGWQAGARTPDPVDAPAADPVLDAMGDAPVSLDQVVERTGLEARRVAAGLSRLEIEGRVAALAGGLFQRLETTS